MWLCLITYRLVQLQRRKCNVIWFHAPGDCWTVFTFTASSVSASSCSPLWSGLNLRWHHRHASLLGHRSRHSIRLFRKDKVLVLMKSLLENLRVQKSMWIQRAPEHWSRLPPHWQSMPCLAMRVNRPKWASSEHFLYHLPRDPCLSPPPFSASVLTRLLPWFIITQSKVLSEEAKFAGQTLNSKQHQHKQLFFYY